MRYDLCHEDYDEFPLGDEKSKEAHTKRISDAFKMPFPDREKSMIGPEVVNAWSFNTSRRYPSILYQLLKYALVNCPRLQYMEIKGMISDSDKYNIQLTPSDKVRYQYQIDNNNPTSTSQ